MHRYYIIGRGGYGAQIHLPTQTFPTPHSPVPLAPAHDEPAPPPKEPEDPIRGEGTDIVVDVEDLVIEPARNRGDMVKLGLGLGAAVLGALLLTRLK